MNESGAPPAGCWRQRTPAGLSPRLAQGQPRVSLGPGQDSGDPSSSPDSGASARSWLQCLPSWLGSWPVSSVNGIVASPQGRAVVGRAGPGRGRGSISHAVLTHGGQRRPPGGGALGPPAPRGAWPSSLARSVVPHGVSPWSRGAKVSVWGRRVCRKRRAIISVPCECDMAGRGADPPAAGRRPRPGLAGTPSGRVGQAAAVATSGSDSLFRAQD